MFIIPFNKIERATSLITAHVHKEEFSGNFTKSFFFIKSFFNLNTWNEHSRAGRLETMTDSLVSYHQPGRVFTADGRSVCAVNVSRGRGREAISGTESASGSCEALFGTCPLFTWSTSWGRLLNGSQCHKESSTSDMLAAWKSKDDMIRFIWVTPGLLLGSSITSREATLRQQQGTGCDSVIQQNKQCSTHKHTLPPGNWVSPVLHHLHSLWCSGVTQLQSGRPCCISPE